MNDKKFTIQAKKTLSEAVKLYQLIDNDPCCYSRSDDIKEVLTGLIYQIGGALYPDACSILDIIDEIRT